MSSTGRHSPTSPGSISEDEARTGIGAGHGRRVAERTAERTFAERMIHRASTATLPSAQTAMSMAAGSR